MCSSDLLGAVTGGTSDLGAVTGGTGDLGAVTGGTGNLGAVTGDTGDLGVVASQPVGEEEEIMEGLGQPEGGEGEIQGTSLDEDWDFQPLVRVVPSAPRITASNPTQRYGGGLITAAQGTPQEGTPAVLTSITPQEDILEVSPQVVLPAQLPGDILKVVEVTGRTRNSATLLCLMSNGQKCRIRYRHLTSILGFEKVEHLLSLLKL